MNDANRATDLLEGLWDLLTSFRRLPESSVQGPKVPF